MYGVPSYLLTYLPTYIPIHSESNRIEYSRQYPWVSQVIVPC